MKKTLFFSLLASTIAGSIFADSVVKKEESPKYDEYHNRIAVFYPNHVTYERIKPESLYVGVEGWAVNTLVTGSHMGTRWDSTAEGEFRMGYNFFYCGQDHFTPIAGFGILKNWHEGQVSGNVDEKEHILPAIAYGTLGFLYDHEFNRLFNLGLNVKGLIGGAVNNKYWGNPVVGVDTALPITFRFGYHRRWDFRIEPFNIFLHGQDIDRDYFGFRGTVGFRF